MEVLIVQDTEQNASKLSKRYSLLKTLNLRVQGRDENASLWLGLTVGGCRKLMNVDVTVAA